MVITHNTVGSSRTIWLSKPQGSMKMNINLLSHLIKNQADRLFPARTDQSMFLKMYSELGELADAKTEIERGMEMADVLIMLLDYAAKHRIDVEQCITIKMSINDSRTWQENELGVFSHVK